MAKIKLNNKTYPIPDSKLAAATGSFISHLGTIAGNGLKVVIGGVEYSVDASKVAGAIAGLEEVFGELNTSNDNVSVVLAETEFDFMHEPQYIITEPLEFIVGKSYTVNWKNEVYECVAFEIDGVVHIGDVDTIMVEGFPKNPPFMFQILPPETAAAFGGYAIVVNDNTSEIVKCSIVSSAT
jgi:hypothetical protein